MSKIDEILEGYKNGQLTYIDREGEHKISVKEFVKTGSDNVLQKLNRTEAVLLKVANAAPEKLKWVNDFAMMKVINELYESVDDLLTKLIEKDTEIERLNNEAAASRVSLETEDDMPKEEAEKLLKRVEELEAERQTIQSHLNNIIVERDELNEKYMGLEERFNKSVDAYKELKAERDNINAQLDASVSESEQKYNELVKKYDELNDNMNAQLDASASESEQKYNELVKKYDELNDQYESLQSETDVIIGRHNETIKQDEYEIQSLKTKLNNAGEENTKLNDKITELQKMKSELEKELNSLNEEMNIENVKKIELKDSINQLKEKCKETSEELYNLKESFGEATGQIRNLDSTNVELQNKVNEQDTLIAGLNTTIESINNEKTELQNSLEEKTKENALLAAKIRNSEKDTERLNMFESAINEMLNSIGWDVNTNKQTEQAEQPNTLYRMGDNQVVDFNIGM